MKINIAQIGYGYWGKRLASYFKKDKNLFLKYICALNVENNKEFTRDINKIWQDKSIEAVVVATPIDTHYSIVKKALRSNKNVLCEKPLARKTKQVLELKRIAQKKKLLLLTEFTYTFSKSIQRAKQIIDSNTIGEIKSIELSLKYLGRFLKYDSYWLFGSHLLSILDVFVPLQTLTFKKIDLLKDKKRTETGLILFKNKKITGKAVVSSNYPEKEMKLIIYGEKGTLIYSSMQKPSLSYSCYKKTKGILGDKLITKKKTYNINEKDNLQHAVDYFKKCLKKQAKSNIDRAVLITKILENTSKT
ncbi:hypothetical protein AMJ47_00305 [Parcubacteria bacterium DG_72]|nr:MAG: hypothetical protein AMJ47_00305 [Parcubacteria bacterium DG_72]